MSNFDILSITPTKLVTSKQDLSYDQIGLYLIPIVNDLRARMDDLEQKILKLEQRK